MLKNQKLQGSSGRPIIYDLHLQEEPSPLLILLHGFKSYKDWGAYNLLAEYFHAQGLSVCKFNFSHNGGTAEQVIDFPDLEAFGRNTFGKEMDDVQVILNHLLSTPNYLKGIDPSKIYIAGHSRGGAIAALTAIEDDRISGLILLNAVTDLAAYMARIDTAKWRSDGVLYTRNGRTMQDMPLYLDLLDNYEENSARFDLLDRATKLKVPSLIIHCQDDEIIPVERAKVFADRALNSELLVLEQGGHTLGAKQPWDHNSLPIALESACVRMYKFITIPP